MPNLRLAALLAVLAVPAAARQDLTPEQFLDLAEGRTLTFVDAAFDDLVGIETFLTREQTLYMRQDGSCARGTVTVRDGQVCFDYDDEAPGTPSHCWYPFREGLRLYVALAEPRDGDVQRVAAMTEEPVSCGPPAVS